MSGASTSTQLDPPILSHADTSLAQQPQESMLKNGDDSMSGTLYTEPSSGIVYQIMYPMSTSTNHVDTQMYTRSYPTVPIPIPDNPAAQTIPVSCGNVVGKMHLHLFLCPGIHQPCIEHGNELLTPKQFTVRADKEKQKDWKASIRIGKSSLRVHMEARTIDFHDHMNRCSGKCQSRNYVNSMNDVKIEEIQNKKAKRSAESAVLLNELTEASVYGDGETPEILMDNKVDVVGEPQHVIPEKKGRGRPKGSVNKSKKDDQNFTDFPFDDLLGSSNIQSAPTPAGCTPFNEILNCLQHDPKHFWEQMHSTGVISHFCDDIIVSAINLKQSVLTMSNISTSTANCLTRSAFSFGIQSMMVQRVQSIEKSVVQQQKHQEMLLDMMKDDNNNIPSTSENDETAENVLNNKETS